LVKLVSSLQFLETQLTFVSLDGGGVRGLAALVILEQVMDIANEKRRKAGLERQEPWQMFDIIGGTSTGG
jgi:patatin-like phospholipase/acyl hydrolase